VERRGEELEEAAIVGVERRWQAVKGEVEGFGEEYIGCRGIFIMLKNIKSSSSLELLLISFIHSSSQLELLLILLAHNKCGSS
jgi:hypothetical protein